MSFSKRMFEHGGVYWVNNRLAEGLPFVPNEYLNYVLYGILAVAQERYPSVTICDAVILQNHYHLLVVLEDDPKDLARFMNHVDGELAKTVTRILGKYHYKVWSQRYCPIRLLDSRAVIEKLTYTYLNPSAAHFCGSIEKWTGVSTWKSYFDPEPDFYKWVRPRDVPKLPNSRFSKKQLKKLMKHIELLPGRERAFQPKPFAWAKYFTDTKDVPFEDLRERLVRELREREGQLAVERKQKNIQLADPEELALQNPHKHYRPKKRGKRVYCVSTDPELQEQFLELYTDFCEKCDLAWESWKEGDFSAKYPPGAFLPSQAPRINIAFPFT